MPWYLLSIKARKNLIMIILRSGKGDILNAGILQLSLANFTSVSYLWLKNCNQFWIFFMSYNYKEHSCQQIMKIAWSVATVLSSINTKSE